MLNWPPQDCPICASTSLEASTSIRDHSISGKEFRLGRCRECGFQLTLDAPDETSIGPYYKADVYISHSDTTSTLTDRLYHIARNFMLKKKRRLVQKYSVKKGRLLDVGSGTGYFLKSMTECGWTVKGVEVDEAARSLSQSKFNLDVVSTLSDESLNTQKYDVISMWHVMEHVHDLHGYWDCFKERLSHDGSLIIAVPNPESQDASFYGIDWAAWDVPRHLWHFRSQDMERLASKYGFTLVNKTPMPLDAYYVSILSEKYKGSNPMMSLIKGMFRGWISNVKSKRVEDRSSIIYIFKQNQSKSVKS